MERVTNVGREMKLVPRKNVNFGIFYMLYRERLYVERLGRVVSARPRRVGRVVIRIER